MKANGRSGGRSSTNSVLPPSSRARLPEAHARGQQPALPRVRPDRVAEQRLVVAALEPVGGRLLHVGPADGQLVGRGDLVVHDRTVADGRPDDAVATIAEDADESVEAVEVDDGGRGMGQVSLLVHYRRQRGFSTHPGASVQPRGVVRECRSSSAGSAACAYACAERQPGWVVEAVAVERLRLRSAASSRASAFAPSSTGWRVATALAGFVLNDADGVVVEAEGEPQRARRLRRGDQRPRRRRSRASAALETTGSRPASSPEFTIAPSEDGGQARTTLVAAGCRHVRRLPARALRSRRPPLPLSVHQLHQLWAALHDRASRPVRPGPHDDGRRSRCARPAGASTTTRATAASTPSRTPAPTAAPG